MTRDHQRVTEYLLAENAVLKEQLRGRRLRFTDAQRRRLACAANQLARKVLAKLETLVTPDTLLRWYRKLVAAKYDGSTNLNAYAERFVGSVRRECLARVIPLGEHHLRHVLKEYVDHYHTERNHQALDNKLINANVQIAADGGKILRRKRLGGLLNYYHRDAA